MLFDDDEVLMGLLGVHNHMKYLTIKRYSLILFSLCSNCLQCLHCLCVVNVYVQKLRARVEKCKFSDDLQKGGLS